MCNEEEYESWLATVVVVAAASTVVDANFGTKHTRTYAFFHPTKYKKEQLRSLLPLRILAGIKEADFMELLLHSHPIKTRLPVHAKTMAKGNGITTGFRLSITTPTGIFSWFTDSIENPC